MKIKQFLLNCFLLVIPIFIWNIILINYLPQTYGHDIFGAAIPKYIDGGENILRLILFGLPLFMALSIQSQQERIGFIIYLFGIFLYFTSWILVIIYPQSGWSMSAIGFTAPAFTTIIWFIGIGLIGHKGTINIPNLSWIYISLSILFVVIHTIHAYVVFQRL